MKVSKKWEEYNIFFSDSGRRGKQQGQDARRRLCAQFLAFTLYVLYTFLRNIGGLGRHKLGHRLHRSCSFNLAVQLKKTNC